MTVPVTPLVPRTIPQPRAPRHDDVPARPAEPEPASDTAQQPTLPAPSSPWPEPWHYSRATRPRSEFWDAETASWHSRGPRPRSPEGD